MFNKVSPYSDCQKTFATVPFFAETACAAYTAYTTIKLATVC